MFINESQNLNNFETRNFFPWVTQNVIAFNEPVLQNAIFGVNVTINRYKFKMAFLHEFSKA